MKRNKDISSLVRKHILTLNPYSSARDEFSGVADIYLDANENALGAASGGPYHRYPDPLQWEIKQELAAQLPVGESQIFLGNGSDEVIDLLIRAFCYPGIDHIVIMPPTYGMYKVSADIHDVATREVPLDPEFQIDLQALSQAWDTNDKITFICSPNNPSGNTLNPESIAQVLEQAPGIVVIDEAYIDFSPHPSWVHQIEQYPHLVVLQTFSKSWGLAGLRLGMGFANPEIVEVLNKIKPPYNINAFTQIEALKALQARDRKEKMVHILQEEKTFLQTQLQALPQVEAVYPSDANFLLTRFEDANQTYAYLVEHKIIVRNRSRVLHCGNCLRITVGTRQENEVLIQALRQQNP